MTLQSFQTSSICINVKPGGYNVDYAIKSATKFCCCIAGYLFDFEEKWAVEKRQSAKQDILTFI